MRYLRPKHEVVAQVKALTSQLDTIGCGHAVVVSGQGECHVCGLEGVSILAVVRCQRCSMRLCTYHRHYRYFATDEEQRRYFRLREKITGLQFDLAQGRLFTSVKAP